MHERQKGYYGNENITELKIHQTGFNSRLKQAEETELEDKPFGISSVRSRKKEEIKS